MNALHENCLHITRRHFLHECRVGLGKIEDIVHELSEVGTAEPHPADKLALFRA